MYEIIFQCITTFTLKEHIVRKPEQTSQVILWCVKFSICTGPYGYYQCPALGRMNASMMMLAQNKGATYIFTDIMFNIFLC